MNNLEYLEELQLVFEGNQKAEDPRDGLVLFGPYEKLEPFKVIAGVIGRNEGIERYSSFVQELSSPIFSKKKIYGKVKDDYIQRPNFPGFEAVFGVKWPHEPQVQVKISQKEIDSNLTNTKKSKRTSDIVDVYLSKLFQYKEEEDVTPNIWFIIVPKSVFLKCRPNSWGQELSSATQKYLDMHKDGQ